MKLEEKIALLRKQKGWSQEELAFRLDVSRQSVSKWETGDSLPDLDKIIKLSDVFEVSTDYLLKEEVAAPIEAETFESLRGMEYLAEEKNKDSDIRERKRKLSAFEDIYWSIVLGAYLIWSFLSGEWGDTWIIWPIAGAVFGLIEGFIRLFYKKKGPNNMKGKEKKDD